MKFRVMIEQYEDGNFVAQCPSLPGCTSEGKKREEALVNIKDAIEGYLASLRKHNETIPKFKSGLSVERPKNPNQDLIREVILEDLPLFKMLATNGKSKSEKDK